MGEGVNDFRKWITELRFCVACGRWGVMHSDGKRYLHPHHVRSRGAGGVDAENLIPLCFICHAETHQIGLPRWEAKRKINAEKTAKVLFDLFTSGMEPQSVRVDEARQR